MFKIGCFSFENGILMGGKFGKKLVKRKSDFRSLHGIGTSTHDFSESNRPPGLGPTLVDAFCNFHDFKQA